jgi:hypothetical protein
MRAYTWSLGAPSTGAAMAAEVARAQNTVSRVPFVPVPVACGLPVTSTKPLAMPRVTGWPPVLSTNSSAMSPTACAGHGTLRPAAMVPLTAVPAAW